MDDKKLLDEQLTYYRARAGEYDEWFLRTGRYDRGPAHRAEWFAEIAAVEAGLREAGPRGQALELACGTGLWTRHLVSLADRVTAIDGSPEVIALNRERQGRTGSTTSSPTSSPGVPSAPSTSCCSRSGCRTCRRRGSRHSGRSCGG